MSALKLRFLSHGTLESRDLEKTRQFYEECLGLDVVRTSPRSMMIRLGGDNTIAVVESPRKAAMPMQPQRSGRRDARGSRRVPPRARGAQGRMGGEEDPPARRPARHVLV